MNGEAIFEYLKVNEPQYSDLKHYRYVSHHEQATVVWVTVKYRGHVTLEVVEKTHWDKAKAIMEMSLV